MPDRPPNDQTCFIDANILYYHAVGDSSLSGYCSTILQEISTGSRRGATMLNCIADAVHKTMMFEVADTFGRSRAGLLAWVKSHPEALRSLTKYRPIAEEFIAIPWQLLPVDLPLLTQAASVSTTHGLLTNDALIVAAMQRHRITHLVTNDEDFRRIPDITVWLPR